MDRSLKALEDALAHEMKLFAYPARAWPLKHHAEDGASMVDVLIVGAGQAGIAVAFGLLREQITNVLLVDRCDPGQEGPWITWARMRTLRTIKELTGPDNGLPAATFRSWYEACKGAKAWDDLVRIPKEEWMAYLLWLRDYLALPVENNTSVRRIEPAGDALRVTLDSPHSSRTVVARKVVVATGIDGAGGPQIPAFAHGVPKHLWAHSSEPIDFAALAGKRVAVLGAGASAFDNTATALEAGAHEVRHSVRRSRLPEVSALRYLEFGGFFRNFRTLDDARKLRFMRRYFSMPTPPPADTLERCRVHANFDLRFSDGWTAMRPREAGVTITTPNGAFEADFAILGTGFKIDLPSVPYLAPLVPGMLFWNDRFTGGSDSVDSLIGNYPYLTPTMQAVGRTAEADRALRNLHLLNGAGLMSAGPICTGLNGMPWGVSALVRGISRDLFDADADIFYEQFAAYDESDPNEGYKSAVTVR
jgi:FAD-dependent urate hydroxylase